MVGQYKVITLCGSTRFKDAFIETQKRLTLEGNIVISVGLFGHSGDDEVWTPGTKEMLSSGFSVSDNTIEYRSQSITGFRQNMNRVLSVILAYLPNAKLDHDNNPTGYSDYTKEYFAHGVYHL